jgi:aldehyde dehydrogenase (NAD+)
MRAARIFKYFAGEALRRHGSDADSTGPARRRDPPRAVGVLRADHAVELPDRDSGLEVGAGLAFGNTVVLKPAGPTPAIAWALADIIHEAGAPPACSTS